MTGARATPRARFERMTRPTLLEDPRHPDRAGRIMKRLELALGRGASIESACHRAGISMKTHYGYMDRGLADEEAGRTSVFVAYLKATTRGRRRAEEKALGAITGAADGWVEEREEEIESPDGLTTRRVRTTKRDWRAAAWWLERAMPDRWSQQSTLHVTPATAKTWNVPGLALPGLAEDRPEPELRQIEQGEAEGGDASADGAGT